MATEVDSLVSAMSGMTSPTIRQRPPIEIIDVDALEPQPVRQSRHRRLAQTHVSQRRPEVIFLLDSDDEVEVLPSRALRAHDADRTRSHRQFISPAPRTAHETPPPLPTRNPPVLPNPRPFSFEVGSATSAGLPAGGPSNLNRQNREQQEPLAAAPISRHFPTLGFGGALISSNNRAQRAQALQRHARAAAAASSIRRRPTNLQQPAQFLSNLHDDPFGDDVPPHIRLYLQARNSVTGFFGGGGGEGELDPFFKNAGPSREKEPYQQHYTHPPQPEPGFTFDFALPTPDDDVGRSRLFPPTSIDKPIILDDDDDDVDDSKNRKNATVTSDPGPSSSTAASTRADTPSQGTLNIILVCAKCQEPLVLNAGLAPDEAQQKRVWGLRCGHMIDEKCLNEIGHPPPPVVQEEPPPPPPQVKDRKGKGKAKATYTDMASEHADSGNDNSIRSRLRSRPGVSADTSVSASGSLTPSYALPHSHSSSDIQLPPAKKRRGPTKKSKTAIEAEFEWNCPVPGCGRVHVSVKIDGVWGPEKDREFKGVKGLKMEARGAVAVFA